MYIIYIHGLASPEGDLQICSEDRYSRGRVEVPDCPFASLEKTFLDSSAIFHEGAGIGNMSQLTGASLASAQLLPFLSN